MNPSTITLKVPPRAVCPCCGKTFGISQISFAAGLAFCWDCYRQLHARDVEEFVDGLSDSVNEENMIYVAGLIFSKRKMVI